MRSLFTLGILSYNDAQVSHEDRPSGNGEMPTNLPDSIFADSLAKKKVYMKMSSNNFRLIHHMITIT